LSNVEQGTRQRAVIFDLDGTLTVPVLDFDSIRAEIGIGDGSPILEAMVHMDDEAKTRAQAILDYHEQRAAEESVLNEGAVETVNELRRRGFAIGVLTRNARRWTNVVLKRHGLTVDGLRTREDGAIKPDPAGVLELCRRFRANPAESWMIGDHAFDIKAGSQAGLKTVLMIGRGPTPPFADQADHVIRSLRELQKVIAP
jgi:HAD superfamily hydrolase (TIGR01509 family)